MQGLCPTAGHEDRILKYSVHDVSCLKDRGCVCLLILRDSALPSLPEMILA